MNYLGKKIKEARKKSGFSRKELSQMIGCSFTTIGNWENNNREPSMDYIKAIAKATGKTISWFFDEDIEQQTYDRQLQEQILQSLKDIKNSQELHFSTIESRLPSTPSIPPPTFQKLNNIVPFPGSSLAPRPHHLKAVQQATGAGDLFAPGSDYDESVIGTFKYESRGRPEYAMRVSGASMEPDIPDGSLILIRLTALHSPLGWRDNDIILVYLKDTETLTVRQARLSPDRKRIKLISTQAGEKIFNVEDIIVRGVVEDVIKDPEEIKKIFDSIHNTKEE